MKISTFKSSLAQPGTAITPASVGQAFDLATSDDLTRMLQGIESHWKHYGEFREKGDVFYFSPTKSSVDPIRASAWAKVVAAGRRKGLEVSEIQFKLPASCLFDGPATESQVQACKSALNTWLRNPDNTSKAKRSEVAVDAAGIMTVTLMYATSVPCKRTAPSLPLGDNDSLWSVGR